MNRPVHCEILATDPEKSAIFYRQGFGWEIAARDGPQTYRLARTGQNARGIDGGIMHRHFDQPVINTVAAESLADTVALVEAAGGGKVAGPNEVPGIG